MNRLKKIARMVLVGALLGLGLSGIASCANQSPTLIPPPTTPTIVAQPTVTPAPSDTPIATTTTESTASAPTNTPTASLVPSPTFTPTPAPGAIIGKVTENQSGNSQPVKQATVELFGSTSFTSSNNNGDYAFNQVRPGLRMVTARIPEGESNPVDAQVLPGQTVRADIVIVTEVGVGPEAQIFTGRVVGDAPIAGALVWVFGDVSVTRTDSEGRYWLVYPVKKSDTGQFIQRDQIFIIASFNGKWGGVLRSTDPSKSAPDLEVNMTTPPPRPPQIIENLITDAPNAQWSTGAGALKWNGDPADPRGVANYISHPTLEDGSGPDLVLQTFLRPGSKGFLSGVFLNTITAGQNDFLIGRFGFLKDAKGAQVNFVVNFIPTNGKSKELFFTTKTFDGQLEPLAVPLRDVAGQTGHIELRVQGDSGSFQGPAIWADVLIVRGQ